MKEIKYICPCCNNEITVNLDDNLNIISIILNCVKGKKKYQNVEFGNLKEDDKTNE